MFYYTLRRIDDQIYSITDEAYVHAFLITGDKQALLVDTCCGLGDIREAVREVTDLPVTVWCTHGHLDHMGGASVFDKVYLNPADRRLALKHSGKFMRVQYVKRILRDQYHFTEEEFVPGKRTGYLPLEDRQTLDLGGITAEAVYFPGHTPGMTSVLLREKRVMILGDACNRLTYLMLEESGSVEEYRDVLLSFRDRYYDQFDYALVSHDDEIVEKEIIPNTIEVCDEVLFGTDDHSPRIFFIYEGILAKKIIEHRPVRVDGKVGNLAYHKDKVFKKGSNV
ncbi:MAG: MBL fold metallo-hydrolase [Solobacterium sp.]|nr:MBL fold metallo-hydrolase [Solobacterium sp.]